MIDEKLLRELLDAFGPSGREGGAAAVIERHLESCCDKIWRDSLGNLYALRSGTSGKKVMLTAHMDQIGLMVSDIDEKGFVYVSQIGGVSAPLSAAREVVFQNGARGVTYYGGREKKAGEVEMDDLYVDIGVDSRTEAEAKVSVGDMAVFASEFVDLGTTLSGRAMDNRISCAALIRAMQEMKSSHDVYAVFTVQEEVGLRGAKAAGETVVPDVAINIDVTATGDMPDAPRLNMKLGGGPAVKAHDGSVIVPVCVRQFIKKAAEKANIAVQDEVLLSGGTDTGAIQRSGTGILSGGISVPCRYIHTPVETVNKDDVEKTVKLICACCEQTELPEA